MYVYFCQQTMTAAFTVVFFDEHEYKADVAGIDTIKTTSARMA